MLMPTSISATESFGSSKGKKEKQTVRIEPRVFFLTNITGLFWQVLPQLAESTLWNAISIPEKHSTHTVVQSSRSLLPSLLDPHSYISPHQWLPSPEELKPSRPLVRSNYIIVALKSDIIFLTITNGIFQTSMRNRMG